MNVAVLASKADILPVERLGMVVVPVSDPALAADFYAEIFGCRIVGADVLAECGAHVLLTLPSGQHLVFTQAIEPQRDLSDTGVHHALRVSQAQKDKIAAALKTRRIAVLAYKEDRPAEAEDNFYFVDPLGSRLQLIVGDGPIGLDHTAIQSADVLRAELFYGASFGWSVEHRVGWNTADYVRARKWAAGEEDMAPGTRRLDKRYTVMVQQKTVARPNMQLFFKTGASVLGVYLATKHYQEPPEDQSIGLPRTAFAVSAGGLAKVAARLAAEKIRFAGPLSHPVSSPIAESLYVRDPSGNFLEFYTARS